MSEIGGSEVLLLIIIGLIVLGPERLPRVANQVGTWMGQARRMTRMMRRQLEEEVDFDIKNGLRGDPDAETPRYDSPQFVQDRHNEAAAEDEEKTELPDDYSPAHEADAVGTGVGDDVEADVGSAENDADAGDASERPPSEPPKTQSA